MPATALTPAPALMPECFNARRSQRSDGANNFRKGALGNPEKASLKSVCEREEERLVVEFLAWCGKDFEEKSTKVATAEFGRSRHRQLLAHVALH